VNLGGFRIDEERDADDYVAEVERAGDRRRDDDGRQRRPFKVGPAR
jgi:hypothetical protein